MDIGEEPDNSGEPDNSEGKEEKGAAEEKEREEKEKLLAFLGLGPRQGGTAKTTGENQTEEA